MLQWVAGNAAIGAGGGLVSTSTATVKKKAFVEKLRTMPESSLPTSVGWMDLNIRTAARSSEQGEEGGARPGRDGGGDLRDGDGDGNGNGNGNENNGGVVVESRERWMVCSSLAGGKARQLALSETGVNRGLVPWVGVAARVPHPDDVDMTEAARAAKAAVEGRAFCFLPLPVKTGLPVHVNAYFELSSNRRDIWFGGDMAGGGAARSEWNAALLQDAVAPAYARLVVAAANALGPSAAFYSLFPTAPALPAPWSLVMPPLYAALSAHKCLRALDPSSSLAAGDPRADKALIAGTAGLSCWVAPSAALFPDPGVPTPAELAAALRAEGVWLVEGAPAGICSAFARHCPAAARALSPGTVRDLLRRRGLRVSSRVHSRKPRLKTAFTRL